MHSEEETEYNSLFTLEELQIAINRVKIKSSHGSDNICYQFLKNLPTKHHRAMLNIINKSWRKAEIPSDWKEANIITFPKPGKDPTDPASYRPISLLSCFAKVMERMIINRLQYVLESNELLHSMV